MRIQIWKSYKLNSHSPQSLNLSSDILLQENPRLSSPSTKLHLNLSFQPPHADTPWTHFAVSGFQSQALWNSVDPSTCSTLSLSTTPSHHLRWWSVTYRLRSSDTRTHSWNVGSGPSFAGNSPCDWGQVTRSLWILISFLEERISKFPSPVLNSPIPKLN